MIKKFAALSLSLLMVIGLLAGCSSKTESEVDGQIEETVDSSVDITEPEESIGQDENITETITMFTVTEIQDGYVLVAPMAIDPVWGACSSVKVPLEGTINWDNKQVGDTIEVVYSDRVTDPANAEVKLVSSITLVDDNVGPSVDQETTPIEDEIEVELDSRCVYQSNGIAVYLGNGYYGKDGSLCPTVHLVNNTDKVLKLRINNFAFDTDERREVEYYSLSVEPGEEHIMDLQHEFEAAAKAWDLDVDFETLGVVTFSLSVIDATDKNSENIWGSEAIETFDALTIDWSYGQVWYF